VQGRLQAEHLDQSWSLPWHQNMQSRDFTVNALMYDPFSHLLFDYVGGMQDCQKRRLHCINEPLLMLCPYGVNVATSAAMCGGQPCHCQADSPCLVPGHYTQLPCLGAALIHNLPQLVASSRHGLLWLSISTSWSSLPVCSRSSH